MNNLIANNVQESAPDPIRGTEPGFTLSDRIKP